MCSPYESSCDSSGGAWKIGERSRRWAGGNDRSLYTYEVLLIRVPSEYGPYTRMKAQRINDNHLSNKREATSRLPVLALMLSVRALQHTWSIYTPYTMSSLALDLVADVCVYNNVEPWISLSTGQSDELSPCICFLTLERNWIRVGKGGWALEIMPCELAHLPAGHHLKDGVMHTV